MQGHLFNTYFYENYDTLITLDHDHEGGQEEHGNATSEKIPILKFYNFSYQFS